MDGVRTERFARMRRAVDVVVDHELKRLAMNFGRVVHFAAREIEADDTAILERDAQLGDAQ